MGSLTGLVTLALSENSISSLPETFAALTNLRVLDLRHNKFQEVRHYMTFYKAYLYQLLSVCMFESLYTFFSPTINHGSS